MKTFKSIAHSAVVIVFTAFACHAQLPVQVKVEAGLIRGTAENDYGISWDTFCSSSNWFFKVESSTTS